MPRILHEDLAAYDYTFIRITIQTRSLPNAGIADAGPFKVKKIKAYTVRTLIAIIQYKNVYAMMYFWHFSKNNYYYFNKI